MQSSEAIARPARAGATSDKVVEVRDLRASFATRQGTLRAVDGVSFAVERGKTLAIVGESGSGKSVTGLSLMRLFGRTGGRIDGGEIRFASTGGPIDLVTASEDDIARIRGREIAMIFQDPMSSLNPVLSVGEQIAEGLRLHRKLDRAAAREEAARSLARVGIPDARRRLADYPHQLSGGMRQRVMIAIALAGNPSLLIADEPTTALDVTIQAQILALLADLQKGTRMAMIFITHDLALVGDFADDVAVMYAGEIVETGRARDVIRSPLHPYTRALVACMARNAIAEGGKRKLRPIPGALPDPYAAPVGCRFAPRCAIVEPRCRTGAVELVAAAPGRAARCIKPGAVA